MLPQPPELRAVPQPILEEYVTARIKQFTRLFAGSLLTGVTEQAYEAAFGQAQLALAAAQQQEQPAADSYVLRFKHKCRFLGCAHKQCQLCKNNPNKQCGETDNFDECFADGQVLKSKCESDIYLELVNARTGAAEAVAGVELVVSVVDGDSYSDNSATGNLHNVHELLKNDDGNVLIGVYQAGHRAAADGRLYLRLPDRQGCIKLPDVCVTDKNDTFHHLNETFSSFRVMAKAVRRDMFGNVLVADDIAPCVSGKFIVKTQRALNDYRKADYPHYNDELTKLKHIGSITAQRLRDIQMHLDCPYASVETVEQLKMLVQFADQNRQVENKMLDVLNMKGKHKHKWDYLREVLAERVVYDDMLHRVWYMDDSCNQGILFACKQAQINLERPLGLVQRVSPVRLVLTSNPTGADAELLKQLRAGAEASWYQQGHKGWAVLSEQLEVVNAGVGSTSVIVGAPIVDMMDDQKLTRRGSVAASIGPNGIVVGGEGNSKSRRSSVTYPNLPSPERAQAISLQAASSGQLDGLPAQHMATQNAGQPPAFQFSAPRVGSGGGRAPSMSQPQAQLGLDSLSDVFRTSSVPAFAPGSVPLYQRGSTDCSAAAAALGQDKGLSFSGPAETPPMRSSHYRRMSADPQSLAGVRQMAMMQAAGMPLPQEVVLDLNGKRSRTSAPGNAIDADLAQLSVDLAGNNLGSRSPLYHMESRGRHTPRSRLSTDWSDSLAGASAMYGGQIDQSDIDAYQQHFYSTDSLGAPDASGRSGSGLHGATLRALLSPRDSHPPRQQGFGGQQQQLMQDQLTGQVQQVLMLNDSTRLSLDHLSPSSLAAAGALVGGKGAGMAMNMSGVQPMDSVGEQLAAFVGAMPNSRQLQHCDSDSFKRFLGQTPCDHFTNTLGTMPEGTYEDAAAQGVATNLME